MPKVLQRRDDRERHRQYVSRRIGKRAVTCIEDCVYAFLQGQESINGKKTTVWIFQATHKRETESLLITA